MSEIIFGTQEHIAGLSREALEADFRYVQDRRMELEEACERLQAENAKLLDELDFCLKQVPNCDGCEAMLDCWECLRADSSQKERKRLDYENGQLRELVRDLYKDLAAILGDGLWMEYYESEMMELGVEV